MAVLAKMKPAKPEWFERLGISPRHKLIVSFSAAYGASPDKVGHPPIEQVPSYVRMMAVNPFVTGSGQSIESEVEIRIGVKALTKLGAMRKGQKRIADLLKDSGIHREPRIWQWQLEPWE